MQATARATGQSRSSRFTPAERVGNEKVYSINQEDEEEMEEQGGGTRSTPVSAQGDAPITKSGFPDRRFKGHRDDPPPDVANPEYRRARTGGEDESGTHVTLT